MQTFTKGYINIFTVFHFTRFVFDVWWSFFSEILDELKKHLFGGVPHGSPRSQRWDLGITKDRRLNGMTNGVMCLNFSSKPWVTWVNSEISSSNSFMLSYFCPNFIWHQPWSLIIDVYDMHQALSIILKFHRFMHLPYLIWNIQSGSPFCSSLMFHPGQSIFLDLKHARNKVHLALENSRSTTVRALRHIFQLPKLAKPATKMTMKWWNGHFRIQFMEVR